MTIDHSSRMPAGFRRLAWSNLAAQSAEQVALAAAPMVAVLGFGAGAGETGMLATMQTLPFLLLSLPAGVLADRMSRRRLMAAAEALRALALLALPILAAAGWLSLPLLALLGFAAATGTVAFSVAAPSLVPALVSRGGLAAANGRLELARSIAFAAGPALAGALVAVAGASPAFLLAAVLSAAAAWLLSGPHEPAHPARAGPERHRRRLPDELRDGAGFAWRHALLRPILLTAVAWNLSWFVLQAAYVPYALGVLGLDAAGVGATLAAYGAGMVAGAVVAPRIARGVPFGALIAIGPLASVFAAAAMAASIWVPSGFLAGSAFFLFGAGPILWTIGQTTLRQAVTPAALLGRVSALVMTATMAPVRSAPRWAGSSARRTALLPASRWRLSGSSFRPGSSSPRRCLVSLRCRRNPPERPRRDGVIRRGAPDQAGSQACRFGARWSPFSVRTAAPGQHAMHLHFDPVGGVAGDMFVAAMLDAFPHLRDGLLAALDRIGLPPGVRCAVVPHRDHTLGGLRFEVSMAAAEAGGEHHRQHHDHVRYAAIRERLGAAPLAAPVRDRALAIFALLADAEARVHGVAADDVTFHEVGAWDSIADIVAASYLIDGADVRTCSIAPLPLGSGQVETAHGTLPVPAPATVLLLEGMRTVDDGLPGERVTPTGAAIVRHLGCAAGPGSRPRRLVGTGIGFGRRRLPGVSNVLRALVLADDPAAAEGGAGRDEEVAVIEFEVDDQTAEDLAVGLDRLRTMPEVLDVLQMPAFGKKGCLVSHVRVLARCDGEAAVVAACFRETATIGLRIQTARRAVLDRRSVTVEVGGRAVPVKIVARPDGGGRTAKAESDALAAASAPGRAGRERLRRAAEEDALRHDAAGETQERE